jgi:hypothetical protein
MVSMLFAESYINEIYGYVCFGDEVYNPFNISVKFHQLMTSREHKAIVTVWKFFGSSSTKTDKKKIT